MATKIGTSHGADAWLSWMKRASPGECVRTPAYDRAKPETWPWPERLARTWRVLAIDHDAEQPEDPPAIQPSIFAQPGWFGVRFERLPNAAELVEAGIKWIVAPLSHGANGDRSHATDADDASNQAWLGNGQALPYRARGIKVGGWMWHQGFHADVEAAIADINISNYTLDLFISNGEEAWKGNTQPELFAAALSPRLPHSGFPVAWSVLGAASGRNVFPFDYRAFTRRGWHILPQAYPQDSGDYEPDLCLDHAERAVIPKPFVHLTISNGQPVPGRPGTFRPPLSYWETAMRLMRDRGYGGVSFWAHDFLIHEVTRIVTAARS